MDNPTDEEIVKLKKRSDRALSELRKTEQEIKRVKEYLKVWRDKSDFASQKRYLSKLYGEKRIYVYILTGTWEKGV